MLNYYSQRKSIKDNSPVAPNNRYGTKAEMERQYHLYCASAATNADENEYDSIEWGTIEHGIIESKTFDHRTVEPEAEQE